MRRLVSALPAGSYLALADGTSSGAAFEEAQQDYNDTGAIPYHLRTPQQVAGFFAGLDLAEPGVVPCDRWRPDPGQFTPSGEYAHGGTGQWRSVRRSRGSMSGAGRVTQDSHGSPDVPS
jgi:hypothetical protein